MGSNKKNDCCFLEAIFHVFRPSGRKKDEKNKRINDTWRKCELFRVTGLLTEQRWTRFEKRMTVERNHL